MKLGLSLSIAQRTGRILGLQTPIEAGPVNIVAPFMEPDLDASYLVPNNYLVCDPGEWETLGTISNYIFEWYVNNVLDGEVSDKLQIFDIYFGATIRCDVTAVDEFGSITVSAANYVVDFPQGVLTNAIIEFDAADPYLPYLVADPTFQQFGTLTYQWYKNDSAVVGETDVFYTDTNNMQGDIFFIGVNCESAIVGNFETYSNSIVWP